MKIIVLKSAKNHSTAGEPRSAYGLPNRRYAENYFESLYDKSISQKGKFGGIFLDLDNFKPVNDSLGHAAGDLVLQQLAQRLQALAAADDILCRFGGDEFYG